MAVGENVGQPPKPAATQTQSNKNSQLSNQDVAKIIERNNQGPAAKAVVNINPASTSDLSKQTTNSAGNAAARAGQQSANAGQKSNSLISGYNNKPTRSVPSKMNTNPTFSARSV